MRAMPGILPPSKNPGGDYWCVCRNTNWLQTQIIEQEGQPNYSGPLWAPGWSPDTQCGWVCSLISVFTLCSHTQTHADAGLERCGRSKTAPNSNIHSQGWHCWFTSKCCQLSRCAITHRQRRCRWWQPSRGWKTEGHPIPTSSLQQVLPAWTQLEASPQNMHLQMSHTGTDSASFNFGLRIKESSPWFLP